MIDKKKIRKAADESASKYGPGIDLDHLVGFQDGISWFLDNLWHDISECNNKDFNDEADVLGIDRDGFMDVRTGSELWADQTDFVKWLYIDDLMKGGE